MLTTALVLVGFALSLYYPAMLGARSDWKVNPPGRGLMIFSCIIAMVMGLAAFRQLVEAPPEWLRNIVYTLIIAGLLMQDVILTNAQNRRSKRIERERREGIERLEEKAR